MLASYSTGASSRSCSMQPRIGLCALGAQPVMASQQHLGKAWLRPLRTSPVAPFTAHVPQRHRYSEPFIPSASWGAPVEWATAKVIDNKPAGINLCLLQVDIGDRAAGYSKAGQYIQLKVGESKPGFFAIASPPDYPNNKGVIQLLIKKAGDTAELLCALGAGADVDASPVQGKGFPVDRIPASSHDTVYLFATGSGISPIKALIESGDLEASSRGSVKLYYGVRTPEHLAFGDMLEIWKGLGVDVVPVYSEEGKGYVQDVFMAESSIEDGSKVGVVLCGHKDMCTAITEHVTGQGVAKEHVLLNF